MNEPPDTELVTFECEVAERPCAGDPATRALVEADLSPETTAEVVTFECVQPAGRQPGRATR